MNWAASVWRLIVAWLAYRQGRRAGIAEDQAATALQTQTEKADVAEAIAGAAAAAPARRNLSAWLRNGTF